MRNLALLALATGAAAVVVLASVDSADARRRHRSYHRSSYSRVERVERIERPVTVAPVSRRDKRAAASSRAKVSAVPSMRPVPRQRLTFWDYSYTQLFTDVLWGKGERGAVTASTAPSGGASLIPLTVFAGLCQDQATELAEWPLDEIRRLIKPNAEQSAALDGLRTTSSDQAAKLRAACASDGTADQAEKGARMRTGMAAIENAIRTLKVQLEAFYLRLDEEQKARLLSVTLKSDGALDAQPRSRRICQPLPGYRETLAPIERIASRIEPSAGQQQTIYRLGAIALKGAVVVQDSCPGELALTPMGRLANMARRIAALSEALAELAPALNKFHADLSDTQKASLDNP